MIHFKHLKFNIFNKKNILLRVQIFIHLSYFISDDNNYTPKNNNKTSQFKN